MTDLVPTEECKATIIVDMSKDMYPPGPKRVELPCCLLAPHASFKHMNPRLLKTKGGELWTKNQNWSPYIEKRNIPNV